MAKFKLSCLLNIISYVQRRQMSELKRQFLLETRLVLECILERLAFGMIWLRLSNYLFPNNQHHGLLQQLLELAVGGSLLPVGTASHPTPQLNNCHGHQGHLLPSTGAVQLTERKITIFFE